MKTFEFEVDVVLKMLENVTDKKSKNYFALCFSKLLKAKELNECYDTLMIYEHWIFGASSYLWAIDKIDYKLHLEINDLVNKILG